MKETWVWSLGWEDPMEKGMATHSSITAWRILWTKEPGRLQSMGLERVRHDWVTKHSTAHTYVPFHLQPFRTPLGCSRAPIWVSCVIQQISIGYLFYRCQCICFHPTLSIRLILSFLLTAHVHTSVLYVLISTAALQLGSSVPSF